MRGECGSRSQQGFNLVELMIVVAIIGILAAVALPLYNGYIQTSREGVLTYNISTIEVFQEDFRLRTGSYLSSAADLDEIRAAILWRPQDTEGITYSIAPGADDDTYEVTATDETGVSVCMLMPAKTRC